MVMATEIVLEKRDTKYNGKDRDNFVRCCLCRCYSPFLFYIVSKAALNTSHMHPKHNFFCVECLPPPSCAQNAYPQGSLLNNPDVLRMFDGYKYFNPYYDKYFKKNRLIITEDSKIHPTYKNIARKPMPAEVRLEKLYKLFPSVHQMPFQKYSTTAAMYTELRQKYKQILEAYHETNLTRELYDNIDVMIDRTPLQTQLARNRSRGTVNATNSFALDSFHVRALDSEEAQTSTDAALMHISSGSVLSQTPIPESQSSAVASRSIIISQDVRRSLSGIDISSEDVGNTAAVEPLSQNTASFSPNSIAACSQDSILKRPGHRPLRGESQEAGPSGFQLTEVVQSHSPDTSLESSACSVLLNPNRRPSLQGISDSQEAGPSGLQQEQQQQRQEIEIPPQAKRRRISSTPVNPSPEDVQFTRNVIVRLPRLPGG